MKFFLILLTCILIAVQSYGQENVIYNNNQKPQNNSNSLNEELKLEVPDPKTMPELELEEIRIQQNVKKKSSDKKKSLKTTEETSVLFLNSRKIANTQMTSRSPSSVQQQEMNQAIYFYKANAPESFEYHYFTYVAGNYNISLYPHLKKAAELKPANSDVLVQLAAYNTILRDTAEAAKNLADLVEMGRIEEEVLSYDKDLLNSIPQNSVLLTHGFDDGFGVLYLNTAQHFRNDVKVISLDLMQSKVYRDSLQKDGFELPVSTTIDVGFLNEFCRKNESKNLFLSMTFPKPYYTDMLDRLSVHGLAFAYGKANTAVLEDNEILWNKLLKERFIYKTKTEKGKQLSANYLPLLFYLRENYESEGKRTNLIEIDKAIDQVGMQSNRLSKVNSMRGLK